MCDVFSSVMSASISITLSHLNIKIEVETLQLSWGQGIDGGV